MNRDNSNCNRRQFITRMGMAGALLTGVRPSQASLKEVLSEAKRRQPGRPNLIVLVTDDQRWDSMGCMGNRIIRTPNQDRLASEGVLFTNNFCTTSICMSSRASIFTGMYTRRHQINSFAQPLPDNLFSQTYPVLLRKAGYRTGFIGKWGLGGPLPRKSFDYFEGFPGQGQYFHKIEGKSVHLTRVLTEKATEFLRGCSKDQPFCLSVSFKAPHVQDGHPKPFRYDPALEDLYQDIEIPRPKKSDPRYFEAFPNFIRQSEGRVRWNRRFSTPELYQQSVKGYFRLISGVDVALGKVLAMLDEMGLDGNTVILHTSDNGFYLGEYGLAGKWLMHEESIRTPLIVLDPRLPANLRGRKCEQMTLNVDLAPTLLDLAGVYTPPGVQGDSLLPLLKGESPLWREDFFYEHLFAHPRIPRNEGVRTKQWKYVRYLDSDPLYEELYDLKTDPLEKQNLAKVKKHRAILARLRKRWRELRESVI